MFNSGKKKISLKTTVKRIDHRPLSSSRANMICLYNALCDMSRTQQHQIAFTATPTAITFTISAPFFFAAAAAAQHTSFFLPASFFRRPYTIPLTMTGVPHIHCSSVIPHSIWLAYTHTHVGQNCSRNKHAIYALHCKYAHQCCSTAMQQNKRRRYGNNDKIEGKKNAHGII